MILKSKIYDLKLFGRRVFKPLGLLTKGFGSTNQIFKDYIRFKAKTYKTLNC